MATGKQPPSPQRQRTVTNPKGSGESAVTDSPYRTAWGSRIDGRSDATEVYHALASAAQLAQGLTGQVCHGVHFLIDECVSPLLVQVANDFGYPATFIHHRNWGSLKDEQICPRLLEEDLTLVTNNREDWAELLGNSELHPGLVVIRENVPRARQIAFFAQCLLALSALPSLVNTVIEVDKDGAVAVFDLPSSAE